MMTFLFIIGSCFIGFVVICFLGTLINTKSPEVKELEDFEKWYANRGKNENN